MRTLRAAFTRPRSDTPVPLTSRRGSFAGGAFQGRSGRSREDQLKATAQSGTLYAIIDALSTAVSAVEWRLYRLGPDGRSLPEDERVEVGKHAALDLIRKPNPYMPWSEYSEIGQQHLDLAGESWAVITRGAGIPIELWPVMPHRINPVPHPTKFLAGYIYTDPDGTKIPLDVADVLHIRKPNPTDFYRGLGPLESIGVDVDAAELAAEWNRNFFLNSAEPGGIIQVEGGLSDGQFDQLRQHWDEQHRGVSKAHRVAILEFGEWVKAGYSQRDMQFTELRTVSRDVLMEAYRMNKTALGISDDVNRASALANEYQFAKTLTVPRLERWRSMLNHDLLPQFYKGGRPDVEFGYVSPVGEDDEAANAARDSKVQAVATLLRIPGLKFDVDEALEAFDLPPLSYEEVEPPPQLMPGQVPGEEGAAPSTEDDEKPDAPDKPDKKSGTKPPVKKAPANVLSEDEGPERDLTGHQTAWQSALDELLARYDSVLAGWRTELRGQITDATSLEELAALALEDTAHAAQLLVEAMTALAALSAQDVVDEAAEQQVQIQPAPPPADELTDTAVAAVVLLAGWYAGVAAAEAYRLYDQNLSGEALAARVLTHLQTLSDRQQRDRLGGVLSGAQNTGRIETYRAATQGRSGPSGSIYADETLDENTCAPCRAVHGRFICTTDDLTPLDRLYPSAGGYVGCLGGVRCRGTVTGVWRPAITTEDS